MTDEMPLPIRVLIKGASMGHDISEFPQQREQFTFGRVVEEELMRRGRAVTLWTPAVASETASMAMRTWEPQVKAWAPDVIVLTYGYYECIHLVLPRWLERHVNSLKARPGPIRSRYRRRVLKPVWRVLAQGQKALDQVVGDRFFRRRARRVTDNLRHFIDQSRRVGSPYIVLLEFLEPTPRAQSWFPGMAARTRILNAAMHDLVDEYDDDVVLLPVPAIAARRSDLAVEPNADGFHYSAEVHQLVGEELADLIEVWSAKYPRISRVRQATADGGPRRHGGPVDARPLL